MQATHRMMINYTWLYIVSFTVSTWVFTPEWELFIALAGFPTLHVRKLPNGVSPAHLANSPRQVWRGKANGEAWFSSQSWLAGWHAPFSCVQYVVQVCERAGKGSVQGGVLLERHSKHVWDGIGLWSQLWLQLCAVDVHWNGAGAPWARPVGWLWVCSVWVQGVCVDCGVGGGGAKAVLKGHVEIHVHSLAASTAVATLSLLMIPRKWLHQREEESVYLREANLASI